MAMRAPTPPTPPLTPVMTGLTWQEFLDLPGEIRHASLIDGELFVNAPAAPHQLVVARLMYVFIAWTCADEDRGQATLGPPVQIRSDCGYMPDLAWWRAGRCSAPDQTLRFSGAPDLVVEVLSPSTRRMDTVRKRNDYPTVGIGELWFIDPDEPSALVVRCQDGHETMTQLAADERLTSPQLPGFGVVLRDLVDRRTTPRLRP